jgi:hypothetical protein
MLCRPIVWLQMVVVDLGGCFTAMVLSDRCLVGASFLAEALPQWLFDLVDLCRHCVSIPTDAW